MICSQGNKVGEELSEVVGESVWDRESVAAVAFMKVVGALAAKPLVPNKDSTMEHVNEFLSAPRRAAAGARRWAPRQAARTAVLVVSRPLSLFARSSARHTASLPLALPSAALPPASTIVTKQPHGPSNCPYLHTLVCRSRAMICLGASFTVVLSVHPTSKTSKTSKSHVHLTSKVQKFISGHSPPPQQPCVRALSLIFPIYPVLHPT